MGETLRFDVPEGHRTCDYGAFGIWCRYASQLFTAVTSMERYFNVNIYIATSYIVQIRMTNCI